MTLYIAYIICLIILLLFYPKQKDSFSYLFFTLVLLSIYNGFSYIDTVDMGAYQYLFSSLSSSKLEDIYSLNRLEVGFVFLMELCKQINGSYYFFQFVVFTIELVIMAIGFKRMGFEFRFISILFIFLGFSLPHIMIDALRQGLVCALFVLGLSFLKEKRYLYYILCCAFGFLFHRSSIFLFVVPFLLFLRPVLKYKWPFLLLFIICNLLYFANISFGIENGLVSWLFGSSVSEESGISSYERFSVANAALSGYGSLKILELDFCFFISFLFKGDNPQKEDSPQVDLDFFKLLLLLYFLMNTVFDTSMGVHRLNYYFQLPYYLLLYCCFCQFFKVIKLSKSLINGIVFIYFLTLQMVMHPIRYQIFEYHIMDVIG